MADPTEPARQRAGRHCRDACKLTGQGTITQWLEQWVIMAAEKAAAAGSSAPGEPLGGGVGLGAAAQVDLAGLLVHSHVVDLQEQAGGTPAGQAGGRSGGRATCSGQDDRGPWPSRLPNCDHPQLLEQHNQAPGPAVLLLLLRAA